MEYRLLISIEVIEFIERLPVKTREALRFAIHSNWSCPLGAVWCTRPRRHRSMNAVHGDR